MHPLLRALRSWLDGSTPQPLPPGTAEIAERHRLAGTLYHIGVRLSDPDAARCEQAWVINVAGHLRRAAALEARWPPEAIPPLVFKGADYGERIYQDPGARSSVDLDLLVPCHDFKRLSQALGDTPSLPRYERFPWERPYALGFRVEGVLVELHSHPQPPHRADLTGKDLWERGITANLGPMVVRYPSPQDRVLLWLTNQAKGGFRGDLSDLLDLALALRALGPPWRPLQQAVVEAGLRRPFELALLRLEHSGLSLWDLPPVRGRSVRAAARLLPPLLTPRGSATRTDYLQFQAMKIWLLDRSARRATLLRTAASAPRYRPPGGVQSRR